MTNSAELKLTTLTCACCSSSHKGRQWHNRDTGYGICPKCADWLQDKGESDEVMKQNYGSNGIHWIDSSSAFL